MLYVIKAHRKSYTYIEKTLIKESER